MRIFRRIFLGLALLTLAAAAPAQQKSAWTLDSVFKQLDAESKSFRSLSASIEKTKVTVIVNDRSTESGALFVRKDDKMLIEFEKPDKYTLLVDGDRLFIYKPRAKRVEEYDLGKHRDQVSQFLLLGFGSSGGDLKKNFLVTLLGEQLLEKKKVLLLELTPKDEKVRNHFAKIHLWLDEATWLPVQQKFFETGTGDFFEMRYANLQRNPRIPDSRFKAKWPKDVTKIKPQG